LKKKYPEVLFTGKKTGKELADHYRAADVFVFPSYTDTFGIVIIEALSCGLPVAAHDVIGPRDIIKEDILGCLDEDLSKAAHKALENGTKQQRHDYVAAHYTWSAAVDQFLYATHKAIGT
jgi:glycosyltransferase involved in cell wall biosynthesis